MTPVLLLAGLLVLTLAALLVEAVGRARRCERVRALATDWRMNYGATDALRLTPRVARRFPIPGAAAMRVSDVVYGIRGDAYRYVFTVQYTLGVSGPKTRHRRVATFEEPRDRRRAAGDGAVRLAPEDLPLIEQYRALGPDEVGGVPG
ncbi:MAG TPA: hypothetical protein VF796_23050 [Humisphaera sp.]